jgi:hypothetical protein
MPQERLIADYDTGKTTASRSALLELITALRTYKDSLVLIGGWVPYFLLEEFGKNPEFKHVGSIDIDLAVDHEKVDLEEYAEIIDIISGRDYQNRIARDGRSIPFSFKKDIISPIDDKKYPIQVDFLAAAGPLSPKKHRHRKVQSGLFARIAKGCELAFNHNMLKKIKGTLPGNGETELEMRMLDIPGSIGMKGIVLGERYKEKDAYDIYSVVSRCHDGPISVARILKPFIEEGSMRAGINVIRNKFRDIRAEGPSWVATFMSGDPTEQDRIKAEVFVKMSAFIKALFGED